MANPSPKIVEFVLPALAPDTKLSIFDVKELHVHSSLLKIHSMYFRKFMDSPDKVPAASSAKWKYEWGTTIDEDGTWYLKDGNNTPLVKKVSIVKKVNIVKKDAGLKRNQTVALRDMQIEAFVNIIKAIYHQPYGINKPEQLTAMAEMADFYFCLQIVSKSLLAALHRGPDLLFCTKFRPEELIGAACKLRLRELFNDLVIMIAGEWHYEDDEGYPGYRNYHEDADISRVIELVHGRIGALVARAQSKQILTLQYAGKKCFFVEDIASLPRFYRDMALNATNTNFKAKKAIDRLFQNDLAFDKTAVAGEGRYLHHFLCGKLEDRDLPWDITQTDW